VDGVDRLPGLLSKHLSEISDTVDVPTEIVTMLGSVPSYYLSYFYNHDKHVRESIGAPTRGQRVAEIEAVLLDMYRDVTLTEKPALLGERGGAYYSEAAVGLLASLYGHDDTSVHSVNVRNNGTLPFLPADAVIEVSARAGLEGPAPLPVTPVTPDLAGLITHVWGYEEYALDAALRGGRDRVYRALLAHPLIGQHEYADALADKLIAAGRDHLAWAR
jgi:6-phospho-beta-glucosidase